MNAWPASRDPGTSARIDGGSVCSRSPRSSSTSTSAAVGTAANRSRTRGPYPPRAHVRAGRRHVAEASPIRPDTGRPRRGRASRRRARSGAAGPPTRGSCFRPRLAHERPAVREGRGSRRAPGAKRGSATSSQCPGRAVVPQELETAADRAHGEVEVAVVVVVGSRQPAPVPAGDVADVERLHRRRSPSRPGGARRPSRRSSPGSRRSRSRARGGRRGRGRPSRAPTRRLLAERRRELGPRVRERRCPRGSRTPRGAGRASSSRRGRRGRRRSSRPPRSPCPAFGSSTCSAFPARRTGSRAGSAPPPGAGDVDVEPVRIEVVRDVEVDAAVAVDVDERRPEPVVDVTRPRAPTARPTSRNRVRPPDGPR